jgi:hypothetical protein
MDAPDHPAPAAPAARACRQRDNPRRASERLALFLGASKAAMESFWEAYSTFVAAFREAADRLKAEDRTARFPLGSFPPALPFVSAYAAQPP